MLENAPDGWLGAAMGAGGLLGALLYVRRQLSQDSTAIATDKSERDQIARLTAEIERTSKMASDRITALELDIGITRRERDGYMRDLFKVMAQMPSEKRDELDTDFAQLSDVVERIELN